MEVVTDYKLSEARSIASHKPIRGPFMDRLFRTGIPNMEKWLASEEFRELVTIYRTTENEKDREFVFNDLKGAILEKMVEFVDFERRPDER